jgi:hypothetical protein
MPKTKNTKIKYPATQLVQCPSGSTYACDEHAMQLHGLFGFMGAHTNSIKIEKDTHECVNCINENTKD